MKRIATAFFTVFLYGIIWSQENKQILYSADRKDSLEGRVIIEFFVEKDSSLSGIKPIRFECADCSHIEKEQLVNKAIEVVKMYNGKLTPIIVGEKPLRTKKILPIFFKILPQKGDEGKHRK